MTVKHLITRVALLCSLCVAANTANAQDAGEKGRNGGRAHLSSLPVRAPGNAKPAVQEPLILPAAAPSVIGFASDSPVYLPPMGNVIFHTRVDNSTGNDTVFAVPPSAEIFNESFTTAPASSYLEIEYSCQAYIASGGTDDGVRLDIKVSQDGGFTWYPSSGLLWWPYLLNQNPAGQAARQGMSTYHGFIKVAPSTLTNVVVTIHTYGSFALVGANNLVIRY